MNRFIKKRIFFVLFVALTLLLSACSRAPDYTELTYWDVLALQYKMDDCLREANYECSGFFICSIGIKSGISKQYGAHLVIGVDESVLKNTNVSDDEILEEAEKQIRGFLAKELDGKIDENIFDIDYLPIEFRWDRPSKPA